MTPSTKTPLRSALAAAALLALGLGLGLGSAACAQPTPAAPEPAATAFKVGELELVALRDTQFLRPNDGTVFGLDAGPAAVAQVLKAAGAPSDTIALGVDALLVRTGGRLVLIDTGVGGALQASLAKAGHTPDQVSDILITHTHGDHVGGLVKDGRLAFPNATIRMSAAEWTWLQGKAAQADLAKAIAGKVETFEPGAVVAPGITAKAIAGHTPGHVGYEIASGEARLLDIGDTAHSFIISLARPDWKVGFDTDKDVARESRIAALKALAASGELVFSPHFPYPGVGRVEARGEGFVWTPTLAGN